MFENPLVRWAGIAVLLCAVLIGAKLATRRVQPAVLVVAPSALSVLLIGNSHSAPIVPILRAMAANAHCNVVISGVTPGGETLQGHAATPATLERIRAGHWGHVVLQEQGQLPAWSERERQTKMYPAGIALAHAVRAAGAQPWWYACYARPHGDTFNIATDTFEAMQARMDEGYAKLAELTSARTVPVGAAFLDAHRARPTLQLWNADGIHASAAGDYLAAAVFARVLLQIDVTKLSYDGGLSADDARLLRAAAARVFGNTR